jgi:hypothetical protein
MYLKLLYMMYVNKIKLPELKLVFCRVKDILDYITRTYQGHDFSMVHIAPTISVVHDTQKLV